MSSDVLNGLNWTSQNVPGAVDTAISNNAGIAAQPVLGGSLIVDYWRHSEGLLTISQTGDLTTSNLLVIRGTGSANVEGVVNGGVDHLGDLLTVSGVINGSLISSADVALSGTVNGTILHSGGTLSLGGNGSSLPGLLLTGGTLNANAGLHEISILLWSGGTLNVNSGRLAILNSLDLPQANLNLNGGTFALGGGGTHAGDLLVPEGAGLEFSGGTHTLDAGASIGGVFSLTGGQLALSGDLNLAGKFEWGGGNIGLASGATISNPEGAEIEIADAVTASVTGAAGTFQNEGTFTKGFASNITIEPAFANTGHVTVLGGGSLDFAGGFTQTTGTLEIESSATVESAVPLLIQGGNLTHAVDSTIAADVAVSGAAIMNEDLLPLGSLAIEGDLSVDSSTDWKFRIGRIPNLPTNTFIGYENNSVSEAGVAPMDLNASILDIAFNWIFGDERQPEPTDTFTIIQSNQPITGTFGNQNAGTGRVFFEDNGSTFRGGSFLVTKAGNDVVLAGFAPALIKDSNADYVWTGANGDTDWDSPANWDTFSVPRSNSSFNTTDVSLDGATVRKAGGTIHLSSLAIGDGRLILTEGVAVNASTDEIVLGEDGILQLGEGGAPPASLAALIDIRGPVSGSNPGRIVIDHNDSLSVGSALSGVLSLSHEGEGITHLSGNSAFSSTTVKSGLLGLQASSADATSALPLLLDGGGLRYDNSFNNLRAFTLGSGGGTLDTNGFSPSYAHVIPSTGPFLKDGLGTLTLTQPHTVASDWTVLAGKLVFQQNMVFAAGSSLTGSGDLDISGGTTTFEEGADFGLTGTVRLTGGALNMHPSLALPGLEFTGGTSGAGQITVGGPMVWSAGTFAGTNPATDIVSAHGGLLINTSGGKALDKRTFNHGDGTNPSTAAWSGGVISFTGGAIMNNRAGSTFNTDFDGTMQVFVSAPGTFNNAGTFSKTGGTGTTYIGIGFNNSGTVNVDTGILRLDAGGSHSGDFQIAENAAIRFGSGTHAFQSGAAFSGDGLVEAQFGAFQAAADMSIETGFLLTSSQVSGPGRITVTGPVSLAGGSFQGTDASTQFFEALGGLSIANSFVLTSRSFNHGDGMNPSTATWNSGIMSFSSGATFSNRAGATFETGFDGLMQIFVSGPGNFNNAGTFSKAGGSGTTTVGIGFNNSGSVNVNSGTLALNGGGTHGGDFHIAENSTLRLGGGTHSFPPDAGISGNGRVWLSEGLFVGAGDIMLNMPLTWTGGQFSGSNAATDTVTLTRNASLQGSAFMHQRTLFLGDGGANPIQTSWTSGNMTLSNGAVIHNRAGSTMDVTFDGGYIANQGHGSVAVFRNDGTFRKSAGTGLFTIFPSMAFHNEGLVEVNSGTLEINSGGTHNGRFHVDEGAVIIFAGGTHTFGAGAEITGGGEVRFTTGTVNLPEGVNVTARVVLAGGNVIGAGATSLAASTVWSGSQISGSSSATDSFEFTGDVMISAAATKFLSACTLFLGDGTSASDSLWTQGTLMLGGGAVLHNRAGSTLDVSFDNSFVANQNQVFNSIGVFLNGGTFRKSAGIGTTHIQVAFSNSGTVRAASGVMDFSGAYTQTAGALLLEGGTVTKTGGSLDIQGGIVAGSGNISGNLILGPTAQLLPGSSPGILTIGGNFNLFGGRVVLEIGGTMPGVDHDQLNITGAFQYTSGVIELVFIGGFEPQEGQTFDVIDTGSTSGTPQIVVRGLEPGWEFSAVRDPVTGVLTVESLSDGVAARLHKIAELAFSDPPPESTGRIVSMLASGIPGTQVRLEASDALTGWETIATVTIGEDGTAPIEVHDEEAGGQRFYRLASP